MLILSDYLGTILASFWCKGDRARLRDRAGLAIVSNKRYMNEIIN